MVPELEIPIVLAPLGGGPSTPDLAAAVSEAGGLGFLASGYLDASETADRIAATRALTGSPFGVNVFVPGPGPADPASYEAYVVRLREWAAARGLEVGEPHWDDDGWHAKLELLRDDPPTVVSFTFGCPGADVIASLRDAGSSVWVTVTSPAEAERAAAAGASALVVQGAEAGGHRGSFADGPEAPLWGLLPLLDVVAARVDLPLVATGGIATGAAVAAALAAGAAAAQAGTAFMLCPEAGTVEVHREALRSRTETALTRAFTGRLARGIRNELMDAHPDAPVAYPEIHHVTAPLRRAARERGEPGLVNLWAGQAHELAEERPAREVVERLAAELR